MKMMRVHLRRKKVQQETLLSCQEKNPILNIDLPMDNANDSGKSKPSNSRKQLFQEKVEIANGKQQLSIPSLKTKATNKKETMGKWCIATCAKKHQVCGSNAQKKPSNLQLFGKLCDKYLAPSSWILCWIDDDVFQLEGTLAHVGKMECDGNAGDASDMS